MSEQTFRFQAEVSKILDIVVHSLYSNREIFLRELISNASDACDKLRYAALTQPDLLDGDKDFTIRLSVDAAAKTLTVADNGIGMNHDDLVDRLGTIASSGTADFLNRLSGDAKKDVSLIGQFGVGFYASFMVAEQVVVTTRRAGETTGWRWTSDGKGSFTVEEAADARRGASVVLHLREDAAEFLEPTRLRHIVKTYSDHIALPVVLAGGKDGADETINAASALWSRPKAEIDAAQYKEFYHHHAHQFDDPWMTLHYRAEGAIEYTALLFVPSDKPFNLFHPDRKLGVKLYVNRVFIADDVDGLLPAWLRFARGVVDSPDLPLNVSREMLQHNPVLTKIGTGLKKRLLSELDKRTEDAADYATFWTAFGAVLKEGLYEDFERRDDILKLCRFRTTAGEMVGLADYVARMKDGQDAIYYITGDNAEALARSPQLEGFHAKGVEVLLLTDPIDEFWTGVVHTALDKPLKPAAASGDDLDKIAASPDAEAPKDKPEDAAKDDLDALIGAMTAALDGTVEEVRVTHRLTDSPVCLNALDGGMSLHLERMLRQHGQQTPALPRVLEVNPAHPLIKGLAGRAKAGEDVAEAALLLLDQARLVEGEAIPDPLAFARRLDALLLRGLNGG